MLTTSTHKEDEIATYTEKISRYFLKSSRNQEFLDFINLLDAHTRLIEFPPASIRQAVHKGNSMIRLLIVHEVRLVADLTASVLCLESDLDVVASVYTADAALALLKKTTFDLILLSVTLPNNGAAMLTHTVAKMDRSIKILITGTVEAKAVILRWLEAGAIGYVHVAESVATLVQRIRSAAQGDCIISPLMAAALLTRVSELKQQIFELNGWQALNSDNLYSELTVRECEVLDLIEQRYSNQGIGNALYIELGTVKNHVHNIMHKLGVRNRQQAATVARQALANAVVPIKM